MAKCFLTCTDCGTLQILQIYKQNIPNFADIMHHLPPENQQVLRQMYDL